MVLGIFLAYLLGLTIFSITPLQVFFGPLGLSPSTS